MIPAFNPLAQRAWAGLAIAVLGAIAALSSSYLYTMHKIVEEPDITPSASGAHWSLKLGGPLQTAILLFSFRSLMRSHQHRVVLSFYLGVGFVALSSLRIPAVQYDLASASLHPASLRFLVSTIVMMSFAVVGTRVAFSLPISLPANWILRITQVRSSQEYIAANQEFIARTRCCPVLVGSTSFRCHSNHGDR